jgi:uncharacterized membrane protein HdeD (DUF308 family)
MVARRESKKSSEGDMDKKSQAVLVVGILAAAGGIIIAAPTWASLVTPAAVGGFLVALAGVLGTAFGVKS